MTSRTIHLTRLAAGATKLAVLVAVCLVVVVASHGRPRVIHYGNVVEDRTPAEIMAAHHCWSGEGPVGVIPGHSVVDLGDGPVYTDADTGFGIWLDGRPGRLFGFCR